MSHGISRGFDREDIQFILMAYIRGRTLGDGGKLRLRFLMNTNCFLILVFEKFPQFSEEVFYGD